MGVTILKTAPKTSEIEGTLGHSNFFMSWLHDPKKREIKTYLTTSAGCHAGIFNRRVRGEWDTEYVPLLDVVLYLDPKHSEEGWFVDYLNWLLNSPLTGPSFTTKDALEGFEGGFRLDLSQKPKMSLFSCVGLRCFVEHPRLGKLFKRYYDKGYSIPQCLFLFHRDWGTSLQDPQDMLHGCDWGKKISYTTLTKGTHRKEKSKSLEKGGYASAYGVYDLVNNVKIAKDSKFIKEFPKPTPENFKEFYGE